MSILPGQPCSTLFPYTTLFRSAVADEHRPALGIERAVAREDDLVDAEEGEAAGKRCARAAEHRIAIEHLEVFDRSEEHTSELQSQFHLVCRLLLEKKKYKNNKI